MLLYILARWFPLTLLTVGNPRTAWGLLARSLDLCAVNVCACLAVCLSVHADAFSRACTQQQSELAHLIRYRQDSARPPPFLFLYLDHSRRQGLNIHAGSGQDWPVPFLEVTTLFGLRPRLFLFFSFLFLRRPSGTGTLQTALATQDWTGPPETQD